MAIAMKGRGGERNLSRCLYTSHESKAEDETSEAAQAALQCMVRKRQEQRVWMEETIPIEFHFGFRTLTNLTSLPVNVSRMLPGTY